jgi:hypothetical protein
VRIAGGIERGGLGRGQAQLGRAQSPAGLRFPGSVPPATS